MMILTPEEKILIALLQAALWDKKPEAACFRNISEAAWEMVYTLSVQQGIQAIIFDAIIRLPIVCQPPQKIRLQWAVNVKATEIRYRRYKDATTRLVRFYREHNLRMMLLKGTGIAAYYPVPDHRESGDIDIWLFGDYERGNLLITENGKKIYDFGEKHSCFYFEGIPVENHKTFLNIRRFKIDWDIEKTLYQLLETENCDTLYSVEEEILLPPATFNAIFIARHMATHFPREFVLRHLCDWARFLYINKGRYSTEKLNITFEGTAKSCILDVFTQLAVRYLGMPMEYAPHKTKSSKILEDRIFSDILRPAYRNKPSTKNHFRLILWKWNRFRQEQWKYKLIYGENMGERIVRSLIWHFRNSKKLFR